MQAGGESSMLVTEQLHSSTGMLSKVIHKVEDYTSKSSWYRTKMSSRLRAVWEAMVSLAIARTGGTMCPAPIGSVELAQAAGVSRSWAIRLRAELYAWGWVRRLDGKKTVGGAGKKQLWQLKPYSGPPPWAKKCPVSSAAIPPRTEVSTQKVGVQRPWRVGVEGGDEPRWHAQAMSGFGPTPHARVTPKGFSLRDEHITPKAWTEGLAAAVKCGLLEEGERARDLFVGVVGRAYRIARKPLAFVAGVLRKQLWRVVSDDDVREGWRRLRPSVPVVVKKPRPTPDTWEALKPKAANLGGILGNILAGLRPAALLDP